MPANTQTLPQTQKKHRKSSSEHPTSTYTGDLAHKQLTNHTWKWLSSNNIISYCWGSYVIAALPWKSTISEKTLKTCPHPHASRTMAWPYVFLNGSRDFSCRAPFRKPCTFACVPARFCQSVFVAPLQHGHCSREGGACMFLWMRGQCFCFCRCPCIFFPGKAHAANSIGRVSRLVRMDQS